MVKFVDMQNHAAPSEARNVHVSYRHCDIYLWGQPHSFTDIGT